MALNDLHDPIAFAKCLTRFLDPQHSIIIWIHLSGTMQLDDIETQKCILNQLFDIIKPGPRYEIAEGVLKQFQALQLPSPDISDVQEAHQNCLQAIANPSDELSKLLDVLAAEEIQEKLSTNDRISNANMIATESEVPVESLHQLYDFAQLYYNLGDFGGAGKILEQYLSVCTEPTRYLATLWGLIAAYNLGRNPLAATEHVLKLSDVLESTSFPTAGHALMQRCWLLHWSLYSLFSSEMGIETCLEFFMRPLYLNAIETECPWLLRYLVVASAIIGKNTPEIAKSASLQKYHLNDPFCSFFEALYVEVDFQKVAQHVREIESVITYDYFLFPISELVLFSIKKLVFNEIATLYTRITVEKLAFFMGEADPNFDVTMYFNPGQETFTNEDGSILSFPAVPEARREVLSKLDNISHHSSNIIASIFKQEHK